LNETSAGYWAKVVTAIISKRGTDVIILFVLRLFLTSLWITLHKMLMNALIV